jgi:hypothetical protein
MNDMITHVSDQAYDPIAVQADKLRADIRSIDHVKNRLPRTVLAMVASKGRIPEVRDLLDRATDILVATLVQYDDLLSELERYEDDVIHDATEGE